MKPHFRRFLFWTLSCVAVLLLAALDLAGGSGGFGWPAGPLLWKLRLPRAATALLAGASLALGGAQMQAVFRNPLADPHIMGVSGGAGLGAAIATLALSGLLLKGPWSGASLAAAAFAGAALASVFVIRAAARIRAMTTLLLFGVMLGFIFSAVSSLLQYLSSEEGLKLFYSWAAGSFAGSRSGDLGLMAAALGIGTALAIANRKGLDLILFGEEFARLSGAHVRRIRTLAMLSCCLLTGTVTAFCGPVGFVGIMAPHLVRRLTGTARHRVILPGSLLAGAAVGLLADVLSQCGPVPLPAGSTMALIGIPFILLLLCKKI